LVTPSESVLTFLPVADSMIQSAAPTTPGGTATTIAVDNSPIKYSLLRFTVSGVNGRPVRSAGCGRNGRDDRPPLLSATGTRST
jgi:hypothetical protein